MEGFPVPLPCAAELPEAADRLRLSDHGALPVVDTEGRYLGTLTARATAEALAERTDGDVEPPTTAGDLAEPTPPVTPDMPLSTALHALVTAPGTGDTTPCAGASPLSPINFFATGDDTAEAMGVPPRRRQLAYRPGRPPRPTTADTPGPAWRTRRSAERCGRTACATARWPPAPYAPPPTAPSRRRCPRPSPAGPCRARPGRRSISSRIGRTAPPP
ncbi:CBS domain-containing protein [Streptomyces lydicus]|uniref:CBS domain-containing protein n=1 Tax=Streptomyces lydicus TaxID=47763 RepID=UPI0037A2EB8B